MSLQAPSLAKSEPATVLYVEDSDATAYLFQKALEETCARLRMYRATDGVEGLAFLRREGVYHEAPTPHLIILDINLPKKNGLEVLTTLQQIETLKHVPKVVFTSSTEAAVREKALALGADQLFSKNGGWDSFVETAKAVCSLLPQQAP